MLKEKLKNYKIILASGSPRRQQFLKAMDLDFEIRLKEVEEVYPENLRAQEITNYLAELKAATFEGALDENEIVITSDTLVWMQNKALGKPKNHQEAVAILQVLSNATHEVITSVCFTTKYKTETLFEITKVTFKPLTASEIDYYIQKYQPFDKAGAYGIQEWIGLIGITKIEGSYSNVVGLPTEKVYAYLFDNF